MSISCSMIIILWCTSFFQLWLNPLHLHLFHNGRPILKGSETNWVLFDYGKDIGLERYSLRYKMKVMFGEISLKLRQMNWNVVRNNVSDVFDELPSQIIILYTCLTIDIWTRQRGCTSTWFYALWCHLPKMVGFQ